MKLQRFKIKNRDPYGVCSSCFSINLIISLVPLHHLQEEVFLEEEDTRVVVVLVGNIIVNDAC